MERVARIVLGLVCGWLLSRLRLVPGSDWLDGPVVPATAALGVRAAALALVGLSISRAARGLGAGFLAALAAGYAAHGLLLGSPLGLPALDALLIVLVASIAGRFAWPRADPGDQPAIAPATWGERIGLFLAGGGAAVAIEVAARHLRLLGGGLVQDDSAFGTTFALLVALGAGCFGWLGSLRPFERSAFPWSLAATASAAFASLAIAGNLGDAREYQRFLTRWQLDTTWVGSLHADALLAGAILVAPAFALGAGFASARGARSTASAILGGAAGLALLPHLLRVDPVATTGVEELFAAQLVPVAALVALLGAALALLSIPGRSARARWTAVAAALPLCLPVLFAPAKPLFLLSPWERWPVLPFLAFETPEGLMTVENADGALKAATLDRRWLSPGLAASGSDREQVRASFACLPEQVRGSGRIRVLLVGQLTALRAGWLEELGASRVDRTGAWHASMPRLEGELLKDLPRPAGDVIAPSVAAERLAAGAYDLAIVLAASVDPPRWRAVSAAPPATVVVRWTAIEEPLAAALPESTFADGSARPVAILAGSGLEHPALGVVTNASKAAEDASERPEFVLLRGTPPGPRPIGQLLERRRLRADGPRRELFAELARQESRPLTRALAAFWSAQLQSSPFETEAESIELDGEVLSLLRSAALERQPSLFVRAGWEWLARVLVGKRDIESLYEHVGPVAQRWAPWPKLEIALAHADLEALDPELAIARLEPLSAAAGAPADLWIVLALAREASGDETRALEAWRAARRLRPADHGLLRRLAMALVRAGDPEGPGLVQQLLREEPEDEELKEFTGPGPFPAPQRQYQPDPRHP